MHTCKNPCKSHKQGIITTILIPLVVLIILIMFIIYTYILFIMMMIINMAFHKHVQITQILANTHANQLNVQKHMQTPSWGAPK